MENNYNKFIKIENILAIVYILLIVLYIFGLIRLTSGANDIFAASTGLIGKGTDDVSGWASIFGVFGMLFGAIAFMGIMALVFIMSILNIINVISLIIQKLLIKKNGTGGVFYIIFNVLFMLSTLLGLIIISGAAAATKITWLPIVLIVIWVVLTIIKIYNLIIRRKVDLSKI